MIFYLTSQEFIAGLKPAKVVFIIS